MAGELTFYTNPMSRGRIVRWMLEEIGAPYEVVPLAYGPAMKTPDYLAINPMGKVPALRHGEQVVTECAAICAYLADAFPEAGLAPPPGSPERGPYYRWLFYTAGPLEAAVTNRACGFEPSAEQQAMAGYGSFAAVMDTLEKAVSAGDYLVGGRFSAADLYLGAHLAWGLEFGTIEDRPAFRRYAERMETRPAAARATELDDALAAKEGFTPPQA